VAYVRFLMTQNAVGEYNTARIVDGDPGPGEVARSSVEAWSAVPGFPMEIVEDDVAPSVEHADAKPPKRPRGRPRKKAP
jgi:hypothetical protein